MLLATGLAQRPCFGRMPTAPVDIVAFAPAQMANSMVFMLMESIQSYSL